MIHARAEIQDSRVGPRTFVWQGASIIRQSVVGSDCRIAAGVTIDGATVGDRCVISHGAFICPGVQIGDEVFVGAHVAFCNDVWPRVDRDGFDLEALISRRIITCIVENGVSIGAGTIVLPGVIICAKAMIAAGAIVDRDIPPHHILRRDGSLAVIELKRKIRRMRAHSGVLPVAAE